ncbi:DUF3017 domain-containing protein [Corynebacterium sp. UBA2622]|uniref:DUF3017 domain-containing protein n=1 Tax=Corynebacterium sp. UBA2622 TaxID=1946393 RepID=UPI0025C23246|nr:DUF3017 domain-containing protein [Corynebacterium sp. UBA2622]
MQSSLFNAPGGLSLDNPHDIDNPRSPLPLWAQRVAAAVFVVGFALSALFSATEHWRRATFTLGAALVWLAVLRYACDSQVIGLVAVRSRRFDTLFCSALGAAMMFLAGSVDALGS